MRLGILGGTFDPVHFGHLRLAEETREHLDLEQVFLVPGALPPHKRQEPITPFEYRLKMVEIAVKETPHLNVLDLEGQRLGYSYTIETLREIHSKFRQLSHLFFIIGIDAFLEIKTWKDYKQLFQYAHFAVINRPGYSTQKLDFLIYSLGAGFEKTGDNTFKNQTGNLLMHMKTSLMDISSTRIRNLVEEGKSIRFLVPDPIIAYINEKGLYRINENIR
ncbi:MAG: nicotinate-nucleotide adenylyltransferase [Deltaproteobacteria bacterium]|nr:nicotinate-nucleotide adenylyltransferase [Deltaproteobacteria bacterium]